MLLKRPYASYLLNIALLVFSVNLHAGQLQITNSFIAGTPAVAADVNTNFTEVSTAVNDNDSRIAALEAAIASLQNTVAAQATTIDTLEADLAAVNDSEVMKLESYVSVTNDTRGPMVQFAGTNVQVVNGQGSTATANGLGNVIVGYDEDNNSGLDVCDIGIDPVSHNLITDQTTCVDAGYTWGSNGFKTGSHYLIVGSGHNYSRWGGALIGYRNMSNFDYASVFGGVDNFASNTGASVAGGYLNYARGYASAVMGGIYNIASAEMSSISGGSENNTDGKYSSVNGGRDNTASGKYSSINGGTANAASGDYTSIGGGNRNTASGENASVSGGYYNFATGANASVGGGRSNSATGDYSSVSGGNNGGATTYASSVLGGNNQTTSSNYQTIPALP